MRDAKVAVEGANAADDAVDRTSKPSTLLTQSLVIGCRTAALLFVNCYTSRGLGNVVYLKLMVMFQGEPSVSCRMEGVAESGGNANLAPVPHNSLPISQPPLT